ncbi:LOW QUALITY PROTEIN: hypothetical protein HID58_080558, partial [Brassica napus]
ARENLKRVVSGIGRTGYKACTAYLHFFYTLLTIIITLDRVSLKQNVLIDVSLLYFEFNNILSLDLVPYFSLRIKMLNCSTNLGRYPSFLTLHFAVFFSAGMAEQIKFDLCLYPHFRFYMREVRTVVYSQFVGILQERDGSCHASLQDSQSCRCFGDKECTLPGNNQARGFLAKQDPEAVSSQQHFSIKVLDGLEQKAKASGASHRGAMVDVVAEVGADAVSHGWYWLRK